MISNKEIDNLFKKLGYIKKILPDDSICYMKGNIHCKFEYSTGLNAYILSSCESSKEAECDLFEDDELYSEVLDEKRILNNLESDLKEFF